MEHSANVVRRILCDECGYEGLVHAHETEDNYPPEKLFASLGKDDAGFIHFLCPSCHSDIGVDPLAVLPESPRMIGKSAHAAPPIAQLALGEDFAVRRVRRNQRVGCAVLLAGLWILLKLSHSTMVATIAVLALLVFYLTRPHWSYHFLC